MVARTFILLPLAALTACMPPGDFPSLAKRPIETSFNQPLAPRPTPPATTDSAALTRINAALASARNSVAPFDRAIAEARPLVAASVGAAQGSDRWIDGQVAASRIAPLLDPATTALADIEEELRTAMANPASADRPAIEAAMAEASEIVARQADAARQLTERLDR